MAAIVRDSLLTGTGSAAITDVSRQRKTSSTVGPKSPTVDDNVKHMEYVHSSSETAYKDPSPQVPSESLASYLRRKIAANKLRVGN